MPAAPPFADRAGTARVRFVVRHVSELLLARDVRWQRISPQKLASFTLELVLSASMAHLPYRQPDGGAWIGVDDALALARSVSGMQLARSMGVSYATIRRRLVELAATGLIERGSEGYRIAASPFAGNVLTTVADADARDLMRTLAALAAAGHAPAVAALDAGVARLPSGVVERPLLVLALRALETFATLHGEGASGMIVAATIAANVRHITHDPALAAHYAAEDMPPPDTERRPVTLRALSRLIDLPFETVRRRVARLVEEAVIEWHGDGIIVPTRFLTAPAYLANNRDIVRNFDRMLALLASLARSAS